MTRIIIISILLFFVSCNSELIQIDAPENLLSKEKMVEVMKEMVKLESHIQSRYPSVSEYNKTMLNSSDVLFKKMHVTRSEFEGSMDYYGTHQEEMKEIYEEVLDQLNSELGEIQSIKQDSI